MDLRHKVKIGTFIGLAGLLWTIGEPTYEVHSIYNKHETSINTYTQKQKEDVLKEMMSNAFYHGVLPGTAAALIGIGTILYAIKKEEDKQ